MRTTFSIKCAGLKKPTKKRGCERAHRRSHSLKPGEGRRASVTLTSSQTKNVDINLISCMISGHLAYELNLPLLKLCTPLVFAATL